MDIPGQSKEIYLVPKGETGQPLPSFPATSDPIITFLMLPLIPLMLFMQSLQSMTTAYRPGYKIVEIKRDKDGNITQIFEKW